MDGMDLVERLAAQARSGTPREVDVSARVMATLRQRRQAVDIRPMFWCAGAGALLAGACLVAAFLTAYLTDANAGEITAYGEVWNELLQLFC